MPPSILVERAVLHQNTEFPKIVSFVVLLYSCVFILLILLFYFCMFFVISMVVNKQE